MEYRENKGLNARVSLLGFGGMRFPTDGEGKIREAEAAGMLRRALEGGVNYFDTAHYYHDSQSEAFWAGPGGRAPGQLLLGHQAAGMEGGVRIGRPGDLRSPAGAAAHRLF